MDLKELKEILQILEEKEITEFELEEEGMKLRIRKAGRAPANHAGGPPVAAPRCRRRPRSRGGGHRAGAAPRRGAVAARRAAGRSGRGAGIVLVKSPIVGTFYRTPDPNSPPFVSVGDRVRSGQVLCIIEAMKLMNEIEAEVGGRGREGPPRERPARAVRRPALHDPARTSDAALRACSRRS